MNMRALLALTVLLGLVGQIGKRTPTPAITATTSTVPVIMCTRHHADESLPATPPHAGTGAFPILSTIAVLARDTAA